MTYRFSTVWENCAEIVKKHFNQIKNSAKMTIINIKVTTIKTNAREMK